MAHVPFTFALSAKYPPAEFITKAKLQGEAKGAVFTEETPTAGTMLWHGVELSYAVDVSNASVVFQTVKAPFYISEGMIETGLKNFIDSL